MSPPRTWAEAPPENLPDGDPNEGDPAEEWREPDETTGLTLGEAFDAAFCRGVLPRPRRRDQGGEGVKRSSKDGPHGPVRHESHPVSLTEEELLARGQTLAEKLRLVLESEERAKDEAKRLKDLVKDAKDEALAVRIVVENKAERRQVEVQDFVDWATRSMETRRLDKPVGESVVRTRPLTAQEIAEIEQGTEGLFARAKKAEARLDEALEPSVDEA